MKVLVFALITVFGCTFLVYFLWWLLDLQRVRKDMKRINADNERHLSEQQRWREKKIS